MKKGSRAGRRTLFVLSPSGQFSPSEPAHVLSHSLACACQVPALDAQFHGVRTACPPCAPPPAPQLPGCLKVPLGLHCTTSTERAGSMRPGAGCPSARSAVPCIVTQPVVCWPLRTRLQGHLHGRLSLRPHLLQHLSLSLSWWHVVLPSETSQPRARAAGFFCKGPES